MASGWLAIMLLLLGGCIIIQIQGRLVGLTLVIDRELSRTEKARTAIKVSGTVVQVVKSGLCTDCGTCAGICPSSVLEIDRGKQINSSKD